MPPRRVVKQCSIIESSFSFLKCNKGTTLPLERTCFFNSRTSLSFFATKSFIVSSSTFLCMFSVCIFLSFFIFLSIFIFLSMSVFIFIYICNYILPITIAVYNFLILVCFHEIVWSNVYKLTVP